MIKCIIVDDEKLAQEVIQNHLLRINSLQLLGTYRNAHEAMAALEQGAVDLMFLDIRMPGMTGLDFLQTLQQPPLVIITTAYAEYAVKSYELNVIDYLLKPISFERFSKAVDKINARSVNSPANASTLPDHIFIRSNSKFFKVNFSEIIYVQGMKDYLKIHTAEHTLITHQAMNEMEKLLPRAKFMRVHKSYIVALEHIRSIYGNAVELAGATVPIGISYKDHVMRMVSGQIK